MERHQERGDRHIPSARCGAAAACIAPRHRSARSTGARGRPAAGRAAVLGAEGGELVQILGFVMLAGAPYTLLKGAVYIHPTLAEGFWGLMEEVKPVD